MFLFSFGLIFLPNLATAAPPTQDTVVGDVVTNPATGEDVTVVELIKDPDGAPTDPPELAYVKTDDNYYILVKNQVGDVLYGTNETTGAVESVAVVASDPAAMTVDMQSTDGQIRVVDYATLIPANNPGTDPFTDFSASSDGVKNVKHGRGGSNGLGGFFFIPPGDGGDGYPGSSVNYTNTIDISTTNKIGIEIGSVGGKGGNGGDSVFSWWSPGSGGDGGAGGRVDVTNAAGVQVATTGTNAYGIFAYSVSGKGGDAGDSILASGGGHGGSARTGGLVAVTNYGNITTNGQGAHGIYGLSTGGSGGSGGSSWGIVGSGGSGAKGGNGGDVTITNDGAIHTYLDGSHGILAQSIGGTGGNGGAAGGIVAFGGDAGTGGTGGNVSITTDANSNIVTMGANSVGILGQSIGGGGGDSGAAGGIVSLGASGGTGSSAGAVLITNNAGSYIKTEGIGSYGVLGQSIGGGGGNSRATGGLVTLGGSGASGGTGGTVTITSAAHIETGGAYAHALFGQSIGGGGGSAGGGGGLVSLGGDGGGGNNGGSVTVTNSGTISTTGFDARGIFAQSIGGGGGAGGATGGLVSLGGNGSGGGNAGAVTVVNTSEGEVSTEKDGADAIFAQSVGGGGGSGASSGGLVALGGGGSSGGLGGAVTVTNNGILQTEGDWARGIYAQSIGGGGGSGGDSGGLVSIGGASDTGSNADDVTVTSNGMVTTTGANSAAIYAQSVGGGGGAGGSSGGAITIGGSGAGGGLGGAVTVNTAGIINTTGNKSAGVFAQSIGGGGGDGGTAYGIVTIGGSGGTGNDGGIVSATHGGEIHTGGEDSFGIFAQSVGGGGGNGGSGYSGGLFAGFSLGGDGGAGGRGGEVSVQLDSYLLGDSLVPSLITTEQDRATGIFAQSVGGGGGNGGTAIQGTVGTGVSISVAIGGKGASGGEGGTVDLTGSGDVLTRGNHADGIFLQSIGGGGGNGGSTVSASASIGDGAAIGVAIGGAGGKGGKGGVVTADVDSNIETQGEFSTGFLAQSVGGGGGNGGTSVSATAAGGAVGAAAISVAVGGGGGDGGIGDHVDVTLEGSVLTHKTQSDGVVLQSVGGGGGNGGLTVAAGAAGAGTGAANVTVGIGGSGGDGGDAGRVDAHLNIDVETLGDGSDGIIVQSIGGGGGNGGLTISAGLSGAGVAAGGVNLGIGGSGGLGGNGDIVAAAYTGTLVTRGNNATGLLAQSVGGGGGNGGGTIVASLNGGGVGAGSVAVGIGGDGGGAGNGGRDDTLDDTWIAVTLNTDGSVTTLGDYSAGVIAQSVGGGGGNGGYSIAASLSGAGTGSGAVSVGVGGGAGSGGDGKDVLADLHSDIWTEGSDSTGVLIQSVGGGGGNGGFSVSGSLSGAGVGSGGIAVGLGGKGGNGGLGGDVNATSTGTITTLDDRSAAFIAQSIGGGGGNGGFNVSGSLSGAGTGSGAVSVGLGGNGGSGNDSGSVVATTAGKIATFGVQSNGVLAQSVGGGGGNGGYNVAAGGSAAGTGSGSVSVGLGGSGAGGGDGGAVSLTVNETVYTEGEQSGAVIAQSIGGGGGNGGFNISAAASGGGTGSGTVGVGLGGSGSSGGDGGAVVVSTSGDIVTEGAGSGGILAQSVGGGGGNGGFNITVSGSGAGTGSGAVGVGLGGSGEGGGNASTVNLTTVNNVTTMLDDSAGIVVQSIGGGGGNGGFDVTVAGSGAGTGSGAVSVGLGGSAGTGGFASAVTSDVTGNIVTGGDNSTGLLVQSVGGGGGNGGFSVSAAISGAGTGSGSAAVGLGGSGGSGGVSGTVNSTLSGDVWTAGKNATAVIAQSIGGGGGNGGLTVAGAISGAKTGSGAASVSVGGSGGGGGDANTVDNTVTGTIVTVESGSGGVLAQSVGGGGGNGGISVSGTIAVAGTGTGAVSVGIGGSGGDGGESRKVTNEVTGTVYTSGADASGIVAQSLGGGGGNGGINVAGTITAAKSGAGAVGVGIGGSGGGGGNSGEVDNTVTGYVQTLGDNSTGILAQSLGGGGGNGGLNVTGTITAAKTDSGGLAFGVGGFGGDGGDSAGVTNTVVGGTVTTGNNADGIVAQSLGGGGGNGAINVSAAVNLSKENGGTLGVGIGGFGGNGGNAGDVTSTVTTTAEYDLISTTGNDSSAVIAQSIGGGGGNGGLNVTGTVNATGKNGAAIGVGVGGFGGGAGNAGNVTLGVTGTVLTEGNNSQGLIAQSIGGGGGNGGTNVTGSLAIAKPASGDSATTVAASIGVGGFGGGGGSAGDVEVDFSGLIVAQPRVLVPQTVDVASGEIIPAHYEFKEGTGSHGILAQSLGGGGGNGGINVSAGISYAAKDGDGHALLVGVGGFGGTGGDAGDVKVTVTGGESISAYGNGRSAIMAQSTGGGGGNGALNVSGGIVSDSPLIVGVGGMGGNAGIAGDVTVNATTDVYAIAETDDDEHSAGIMAQSLGGGGGNGGVNISGGISIDKGKSPSITVGVGGFGGTGAVSGDVDLIHYGNALTSGGWTHGLFAQSIAGGGGNGGLNVTGEFNWADSENSGGAKDLSIVAGIGGHGGHGADAGDVSVTSTGTIISTTGDYSRGIYAQSIGGGGGTGGMNVTGVFAKNSSPISLGIGGFGSGGGHAGSVEVTRGTVEVAAGKIMTAGVGAIGIEASSIGGGGGDAGMNFVVGISLAKDSTNDGSGTDGDTDSTREHPKHTGVDESVFTNFDKVLDELEGRSPADPQDEKDASKDSPFAAQIAIGGGAGDAGHGSTATVDNHGDIETLGDDSHGILAQSIGGGGGNASLNLAVTYQGKSDDSKGFNFTLGGATGDGGNGARVELNHDGIVATEGDDAYGLFAQSVGGGGGNVGYDFSTMQTKGGKIGINLGRQGGTGGFGADVSLTSKGSVSTLGARSYGILAQSVGNGGGNSSSTTISGEIAADEDEGTPSRAASITVGLEGGQGGSAGDVDVDVAGVVSTAGEGAHGVFAQSVGGGGGNAGDAKSKASTVAISLGASGGEGGTGGKVTVISAAEIHTQGEDALGILAQSVGGGGGTGSMTESKAEDFAIAVGGSGGEGAVSDTVTVKNHGTIFTEGAGSYGILAQSIAGGGGNAKSTKSTLEKKKPKEKTGESSSGSESGTNGSNEESNSAVQVSIAIGGTGGTGAASGDVMVENYGGIATNGGQAIGIFAQSIGGGGGNAEKTASSVTSELGSGFLFGLGIGGTGGTGGSAGDVIVSNLVDPDTGQASQIITLGEASHGIFAMSIGGGGGNGSTVIAKTNAKNQNETSAASAFSVGIGGSGGTGGTGGEVTVTNNGMIVTHGAKAHGIIAQSIGGGGGNGGLTISGNQALGSAEAGSQAGSFALGGSGGDGNTSGNVIVTNTGSIEVFGDKSYGIYAQSVGGGGGDGALTVALSADIVNNPFTNLAPALMNIGIGGSGGDGGDSGDVFIDQQGSIIAHGDNAYGIFAQSVGGGGGRVGTSISSPVWMAADLTISALMGGRDGSNGNAGTVTINTDGDITMTGANSQAYFAQAVNGGGGDLQLFLDVSEKGGAYGEDSVDLQEELSFIDKIKAKVKAQLGLGAHEANGASASEINSSHTGNLYTGGDQSVASSTQSIGGGGGNANADLVINEEAQVDLEFLLGASESSGSSGGEVNYSLNGEVGTAGEQSPGVSVQSIGGGGGNLLVNVRTVPIPNPPDATEAARPEAMSRLPVVSLMDEAAPEGPVGSTAVVTLGADHSVNNDGGNEILNNSGSVTTLGDSSPGIMIQSIGAGGGTSLLSGLDHLDIRLGATGNSTGNGGTIQLSNDGSVMTAGALSHGVILQSIGGGGGAAFTDLDKADISLTLNSDNSGDGGTIDFDQTGDVVVTGDRSIAVLAQSLGGGGGVVDRLFADTAGGAGSSGAITLNLDGNIEAQGQEGVAVFAQSRSAAAQGDIKVTLSSGKRLSFGTNGAGVWISGGANNRFDNYGTAAGEDGVLGWTVRGEEGNESIENHAIFLGQFDLGSGTNSFINHVEQLFVPGPVLDLGDSSNLLTQDGVMMPGDMLHAQRSDLTGSFLQSTTGLTFAELDFGSGNPNIDGGLIDQIYATGTVDLDGELNVSLLNPQLVPYGTFQKTLFRGDMGLTDHGMFLSTAPSVVITYGLNYPDREEAVLDYSVDFSPAGMSQNLDEVGDYFNRIQSVGSSPALADTVVKLLFAPDMEMYRESLTQLSPEFYGQLQAEQLRSSQSFAQVIADGGEYRFVKEDRVIWFHFESARNQYDASGDFKNAKHYSDRYAMGIRKELNDNWTVGLGFSYDDNDSDSYGKRWTSDGDAQYLGASVMREVSGTQFAAIMSYGWGDNDVKRHGQVSEPFKAKANRDHETLGGLLRVSHEFDKGRAYIRPVFDLGVTHLNVDDVNESGAAGTGLELDDYDKTYTWMRPAVGFGYQHPFGNDWKLLLHADFGFHYYFSDAETEVRAGFEGAPAGADPMDVRIDLDESYGLGSVGVDLLTNKNLSIGLQYSTIIADRSDVDLWGVILKIPF